MFTRTPAEITDLLLLAGAVTTGDDYRFGLSRGITATLLWVTGKLETESVIAEIEGCAPQEQVVV